MDLLFVRYTTFVWAPYNLSLISSGDMGLFFYNMFWIWGLGGAQQLPLWRISGQQSSCFDLLCMFRAFYEKRFGNVYFGKTGHGHLRFRRLNLELVFFFFFSYCWILLCSLPFDVSYTVTGVGETSWF